MKQVIDGKLYDTTNAELLHQWDNGRPDGDMRIRMKTLFRTANGTLFLLHFGGVRTDMGGRETIEPVSKTDALRFLETHGGTDVLLQEFPDDIEEA